MKIKEKAVVLWQENLAEGVYSLTLETSIVDYAVPGQFISIFSNCW